ncbi:MAG: 23S rRNA (uracil(1939)-C(5))-methyltransferase RlmD [Firmicutes bacterium HGW-Firmicutes-7]|nr:MAG: 23S rRNA (uracil(1939)-C(5))-methyltransferase RlmD [Firmicutes bacterium HGW-Firmicutes-7]
MKKKDLFEGIVEKVDFPNKGIIQIEDGEKVHTSNVIEGQKVKGVVTKKRKGKLSGIVLEIVDKSPDEVDTVCQGAGECGGCLYQSLPYQKQLSLKKRQVADLLNSLGTSYKFEGIVDSPAVFQYRNKMEYSFGDAYKGGPLALGLHKRASMYDIVNTSDCKLVHHDFNKILKATFELFQEDELHYFSKKDHVGYLRHLVLRKGTKTDEILVNLVTTSQLDYDLSRWLEILKELKLSGEIVGVLNTINDDIADAVKVTELRLLEGRDYFYEELLGMKFKISPFSFFQTNTLGAEKLYSVVREYVGETRNKIIFDLYSGTGTITQMLAPVAKKAVGVEIVEEAVEAAKENAKLNGLENCEFIAGDVLKVLDTLEDKPDIIILDPPRDGIHPKALRKIIDYGVEQLVYVSCKPTSLVRDLEVFLASGYEVVKVRCVDMFPHTVHVETIVGLQRLEP